MDGYAVRSAEIADEGMPLAVSQRIPAGAAPQPLQPGTAARIFTGAPVPAGADAIVMQEDTEALADGRVRILRVPDAGQWIRRSGEDITRGSTVLARGTRIGPAAQGLAASIGRDRLQVAVELDARHCAPSRSRRSATASRRYTWRAGVSGSA